ncbi:MAG TPA: hypothetical protein VGC15_20010 [Acetobacteraceae bacterium]
MDPAPETTLYVPGPVFAHVCTFGAATGPMAGMLMFVGTAPDPLPGHVREALLGHVRRGERVLVLSHSKGQVDWMKAQVALLTAPGGRA